MRAANFLRFGASPIMIGTMDARGLDREAARGYRFAKNISWSFELSRSSVDALADFERFQQGGDDRVARRVGISTGASAVAEDRQSVLRQLVRTGPARARRALAERSGDDVDLNPCTSGAYS